MHNGNASIERSLSDNKNTVSAERTNLNLETLKGLRLAKQFARYSGGAHNVDTLSKDMLVSTRNAHGNYAERKKQEEKERQLLLENKMEMERQESKSKEAIESAERKRKTLDEKEQKLDEEGRKTDEGCQLA